MKNDKNQKNSLIMYTALIFIVATVIVIFAFISQRHFKNTQPPPSPTAAVTQEVKQSQEPTAKPQGIAKTAAELSQENLELLEQNRSLQKKYEELSAENENYKALIEAYSASSAGDTARAETLISGIDYNSLSSDAKTLYDIISSKI